MCFYRYLLFSYRKATGVFLIKISSDKNRQPWIRQLVPETRNLAPASGAYIRPFTGDIGLWGGGVNPTPPRYQCH